MLGLSLPMKEKENRNYSDFFINCFVITNLLRVIISASQNTLQVKYEENWTSGFEIVKSISTGSNPVKNDFDL